MTKGNTGKPRQHGLSARGISQQKSFASSYIDTIPKGSISNEPFSRVKDIGIEYKLGYTGVDSAIANHIKALNCMGYETYQSCSGIGTDHLTQVRVLGGYISFERKHLNDCQLANIKRCAKKSGLSFEISPVNENRDFEVVTVRIEISDDKTMTSKLDKDIQKAWDTFLMCLLGQSCDITMIE